MSERTTFGLIKHIPAEMKDLGVTRSMDGKDVYRLGMVCYKGKDYANAMKLFRFSLNYKDEPPADMMIGILYIHGLGVELDYQKARESLLAGAGKGNIPCLYMLGMVYKEGLGVDKNEETAFLYFNKAAHHGSLRAERELGICYYEGRGVAKNEAEGLRWLHKANERDDPKAREYLAKIKAI